METSKQKTVTFEFSTTDIVPEEMANTFIREDLLAEQHRRILVEQGRRVHTCFVRPPLAVFLSFVFVWFLSVFPCLFFCYFFVCMWMSFCLRFFFFLFVFFESVGWCVGLLVCCLPVVCMPVCPLVRWSVALVRWTVGICLLALYMYIFLLSFLDETIFETLLRYSWSR